MEMLVKIAQQILLVMDLNKNAKKLKKEKL